MSPHSIVQLFIIPETHFVIQLALQPPSLLCQSSSDRGLLSPSQARHCVYSDMRHRSPLYKTCLSVALFVLTLVILYVKLSPGIRWGICHKYVRTRHLHQSFSEESTSVSELLYPNPSPGKELRLCHQHRDILN